MISMPFRGLYYQFLVLGDRLKMRNGVKSVECSGFKDYWYPIDTDFHRKYLSKLSEQDYRKIGYYKHKLLIEYGRYK